MNFDYIYAAKVIADFLQADDSAYEDEPGIAMEKGKEILSALQAAGFKLTHEPLSSPPQTQPARKVR